jgi:Na+/H+ antiporter
MQTGGIQQLELVFLLLLLFVAAFGYLAEKFHLPYPIVLVIAGTLLSFVPGIPKITLNPELVFFVVLPPLLYSAAWLTSWREFSFNMVSILFLAFGLVAFTVFGVAMGAHWLFPGFDWRMGFVLGAVVATTDALAATTIARRVGLPKAIVDILEGESLVNDASGLVALEFAIALIVSNQVPSVSAALGRLAYLIIVGLLVGLVAGWIVYRVERLVDNAPIEVVISIFVPYATYLLAENLHASGVLSVVACGLYLSRRSSEFFSPTVRIQAWAVWNSLTYILNGFVFVVIGLQLPYVLAGIHEYSIRQLLLYGAGFSILVILLRLVWIFPGTYLARFIRKRLLHQKLATPRPAAILIVGWTGMRGVIALAAAIALPTVLENGEPFAQRNLIIFLSFSVIFVTLVLQGLTLPPLVRWLGLADIPVSTEEEEAARREMLLAALAHLQASRENSGEAVAEAIEDLAGHYQHRLDALAGPNQEDRNGAIAHYQSHQRLLGELLRIERQTAVRLRDEDRINDETLRRLEHELDLREAGTLQAT